MSLHQVKCFKWPCPTSCVVSYPQFPGLQYYQYFDFLRICSSSTRAKLKHSLGRKSLRFFSLPFTHPSVPLSVCVSVCLSLSSLSLPAFLSVCPLCLSLSLCLSVSLSLSLCQSLSLKKPRRCLTKPIHPTIKIINSSLHDIIILFQYFKFTCTQPWRYAHFKICIFGGQCDFTYMFSLQYNNHQVNVRAPLWSITLVNTFAAFGD